MFLLLFLKLGTSRNIRTNIYKVMLTVGLIVNGGAYCFEGNDMIYLTNKK